MNARARTIQRVHERYVSKFTQAQREILDAIFRHRQSAFLGARQVVHKTATASYGALMLAMGAEWRLSSDRIVRIPAHDVHVISRSQKHSRDIVRRINKIVTSFNVGVSSGRKSADSLTQAGVGSMERIALANGRYIYAHAGDPEAIQGFPGSVLVDEIGANPNDPNELYNQALSCTSNASYYRCVLIGNATVRGDWWDLFWNGKAEAKDRRARWAMYRHTVDTIFPGGVGAYPEHILGIMESMPERDWRKWYLCEFLDAYNRAIPDEDLDAAQTGGARTHPNAMVVLAIDPGGHVNPTGVALLRVGGLALDILSGEYWYGPTERTEESHEGWVRMQMQMVDQIVRANRVTKIVVDNTNAADLLGKALRRRYGGMVELITVTPEVKQREWGTLQSLLRDGRVSMPRGLEGSDLRGDLARLEIDDKPRMSRVYETGRIHFPSITADNGTHVLHCDIAAAVMLGCEYTHVEPGADLPTIIHAPDAGPVGERPGVQLPTRNEPQKRKGGSFGFGWER